MSKVHFQNADQKEFGMLFDALCYSRSRYQVWSDVIHLIAYSISNAVDPIHKDLREKEYVKIASWYSKIELETVTRLFAVIISALENNPNQDFLGSLYMQLSLGNQYAGQFFTPYHVSRMMAKINTPNAKLRLEKQSYISVVDPCVGGGAMLIAFADACKEEMINYQRAVLFVGQDIDHTTGLMAYIQLSLLGCPGYIVIGNSLTDPIVGNTLFAPMDRETYVTPMYMSPDWVTRRASVFLTPS